MGHPTAFGITFKAWSPDDEHGCWWGRCVVGQQENGCWTQGCAFPKLIKTLLWWDGTGGIWVCNWEKLLKDITSEKEKSGARLGLIKRWSSTRRKWSTWPHMWGPSVHPVLHNYRIKMEFHRDRAPASLLMWAARARPSICIQCTSPWAYLLPTLPILISHCPPASRISLCLSGLGWTLPKYLLQHTDWFCCNCSSLPAMQCQGDVREMHSPVLPCRNFPASAPKQGEKMFFRRSPAVLWLSKVVPRGDKI